MDAIAVDRVAQGPHHVLLADDLVEGLGAVAAVEGRLAGHRADTSDGSSCLREASRLLRAFWHTRGVGSEDLLDHGRRIAALESKVAELYKRLGQAETGTGFGGGFGDPPPGADEDPRVIELLQAGQKIQAIKLYRELTGLGLKDAKDAVERLGETYGAT